MAIADNSQRKTRGKVPIGLRLKAWWDGYDLEVRQRLAAQEPAAAHEVRYERDPLAWETPRIELAQQLWGKGFNAPGEAEQTHADDEHEEPGAEREECEGSEPGRDGRALRRRTGEAFDRAERAEQHRIVLGRAGGPGRRLPVLPGEE